MEPPPSAEAAGAQRRAGWGGNEPSPGGGKRAGPGLCKKLGSGEVGKARSCKGGSTGRVAEAPQEAPGAQSAGRAGEKVHAAESGHARRMSACAGARRRLPAAAPWGRRPVGNSSPTLFGSPPPVPVLRTHPRTEKKRKRGTKLRAPLRQLNYNSQQAVRGREGRPWPEPTNEPLPVPGLGTKPLG